MNNRMRLSELLPELTDARITHPKQVVQEGEELLLRIIRIDPERRRMGLSLRRALDTPDEELAAALGEARAARAQGRPYPGGWGRPRAPSPPPDRRPPCTRSPHRPSRS